MHVVCARSDRHSAADGAVPPNLYRLPYETAIYVGEPPDCIPRPYLRVADRDSAAFADEGLHRYFTALNDHPGRRKPFLPVLACNGGQLDRGNVKCR